MNKKPVRCTIVLKSLKFLYFYSALHVSGTLAPIIKSLLTLHIQPPVTYQLKHIVCFQIMWRYVTIYNLYFILNKICYIYKNNKTCIINVIFLLLVVLCCFVFVSLCVVDWYCDLFRWLFPCLCFIVYLFFKFVCFISWVALKTVFYIPCVVRLVVSSSFGLLLLSLSCIYGSVLICLVPWRCVYCQLYQWIVFPRALLCDEFVLLMVCLYEILFIWSE
jgi:hypothetical protein